MNGLKVNGINYDWGDVIIVNTLTGVEIGCTDIKYSKKQDKELVYGQSNEPIGMGNGKISYEGSITIHKTGVDRLNELARKLGFEDILGVPAANLNFTVVYANGYKMTTDTLIGVAFTDLSRGTKSGDKSMEIDLPFIFWKMASI